MKHIKRMTNLPARAQLVDPLEDITQFKVDKANDKAQALSR